MTAPGVERRAEVPDGSATPESEAAAGAVGAATGPSAAAESASPEVVRSWLEAIARISAAVNNMEPVGNVLNAIAATTCRLLGYGFGAVFLADEAGGRLLIRGSYGLAPAYIEGINTDSPIRLGHGPYGEGPSSRAFRSHRQVVVRDYEADPTVGPWAGVAFVHGFRSMATTPLVVSGRAIGTLNCYTKEQHEFSSDELLLLGTIASQAAIAIEATRLREQQRATITRLEEARQSLQAQAAVLERSEAIHTELTRTVLDGGGLPAVAIAITRFLHGSVIIDDGTDHVLASAPFEDCPASVPRGFITEPAVAAEVERLLDTGEPGELEPGGHPQVDTRTFLVPVRLGRERVARLWVLGSIHELDALVRRSLEHGATVVALELLKMRIANEVEGRLRGELLEDLLSGRRFDAAALRFRAQHLGHDLSARHAALVAGLDADDGGAGNPGPADRVRHLASLTYGVIRRLRLDALVGEHDGLVVVLLAEPTQPGRSFSELGDLLRREVHRLLPGLTATVAIGPWVGDPTEHVRSYRIARGALDLARASGRDRTVSVDTLGVYGLLLAVERIDELAAFATRRLDPLRAYDDRRGSELVETLKAYLAHACRTAETSAALVVHPNTVAYRVRRIEALLEVDLARPETQLELQLALIVDDIVRTADR